MSSTSAPAASPVLTGLLRGLRRRCPNCDAAPLFRGYIKVQPRCSACGHDLEQYRADDAGPYFTVLIMGHLVIGPLLFFPFIWKAPLALVVGGLLPLLLVVTLLALPIIKGAVVGVLWGIKAGRSARASLQQP
jgi:uncharacterized protein (DUF983 family)